MISLDRSSVGACCARPRPGANRDPSAQTRYHDSNVTIEEMRPGVLLDAFVVMPNHCHGIVILDLQDDPGRDQRRPAGLQAPSQGLATIVGGFKGAVARRIREECQDVVMPIWQRGYYDRIIRDEDELQRFRVYIVLNPEKWELDRYFKRYRGVGWRVP